MDFLSFGYRDSMPDAYQYIWAYTLLNYWFVVLIYCVAHEKLFIRFLDWYPLQYLGKISYGLYVYHFPLIWVIVEQLSRLGISEELFPLIVLIVSFISTLTVASLSYYVLEKPFLKLKDLLASYSS